MLGIYVGFAVAVAVAWLTGGARRSELPRGWILAALVGCIALMAADGLNAWFYDTGRGPAQYLPQSSLRLATGLLCGLGLAGFIAPGISLAFWREHDRRPVFANATELARAVLALAAVGLVIWSGAGGATLLSAAIVLAIVAAFWLVNTYIAIGAWVGLARAERWSDLGGYATVGFLLAVGELAGLALARSWLEGYDIILPF
jgi:hypothetical protein